MKDWDWELFVRRIVRVRGTFASTREEAGGTEGGGKGHVDENGEKKERAREKGSERKETDSKSAAKFGSGLGKRDKSQQAKISLHCSRLEKAKNEFRSLERK